MRSDSRAIQICADLEEISRRAAAELVHHAEAAIRAKNVFTVALSGGSTPTSLYRLLANETATFRSRVPWHKTHFFWGDERHVPPDHPDSNYRTAHETMLSKVPVPPAHVHRIRAENPDAAKAAEDYAQVLSDFFRLGAGQFPRFDLVLLGLGSDGHTASLFPGTDVVHEHARLVVAPWVEMFNTYRITLTPPVLNNAASVIFLVSGRDKAEAVQAVLHGEDQPDRFPAQRIRPTGGQLLWLLDRPAAQHLSWEFTEGSPS